MQMFLNEISTKFAIFFMNDIMEASMLWTIAVALIILWILGLVSTYTLSGYIHFLLVIAIILVLVRIIQGCRTL